MAKEEEEKFQLFHSVEEPTEEIVREGLSLLFPSSSFQFSILKRSQNFTYLVFFSFSSLSLSLFLSFLLFSIFDF